MLSTWFLLYAVHVFAGVFWIGAAVVVTVFILPAVRATGPAGGAVMGHLTTSARLPFWITLAAGLTALSGALLYWNINGGLTPKYSGEFADFAFLAGCVLGLGAFVFGTVVQSPRAARLRSITAQLQQPPSAEQLQSISTLQRQLQVGGWVGVMLLVAALAGMLFNHPL